MPKPRKAKPRKTRGATRAKQGAVLPTHVPAPEGITFSPMHDNFFEAMGLPDAADRHDPRFSPLLADVSGVVPAWLGLAECDPLVDEGVTYADHLRLSGVAVDLEIYKGVVHSFIQMGRVIPEALTAHLDAARALRHAFA